MYKNWNCEWKQSDFARCQYRIVEITTDFQDDSEILVADCGGARVHNCLSEKSLK